MRFAVVPVTLLFIWVNPAAADLYRWVDPESGSVKFSSYPPPWYGDADKQRRAPKVERILSGKGAAPAAQTNEPAREAAPGPADDIAALEEERRELLQSLRGLVSRPDAQQTLPALKGELEEYEILSAKLDRRDPKGAASRKAEAGRVIEKLREAGPRLQRN